ncbi:MAG: response regulator transcription factor [Ignavibacteria bacterium]|nr:response regulator transcription factor [Ignavibacteria bacterium]
MNDKIKILIADDHPIFRKGLRDFIKEFGIDYSVDEAEDGKQAVEFIKHNRYDVAIFDIDMPVRNGLKAAEECMKLQESIKIIILTMYKDEHIFNQAIDLGIRGYVLKENATVEVKNAIDSVLNGHYYISPVISEFLLNRKNKLDKTEKELSDLSALTEAERQILKLISESKTSKEIADNLFVSVKTVEKHRYNICAKLNIHGTHALIKYAFDNKDNI